MRFVCVLTSVLIKKMTSSGYPFVPFDCELLDPSRQGVVRLAHLLELARQYVDVGEHSDMVRRVGVLLVPSEEAS